MENISNRLPIPTLSEMKEIFTEEIFGEQACREIYKCYGEILASHLSRDLLCRAAEEYRKNGRIDFYKYQVELEKLDVIHPYSAQLIFYLALLPILKDFYKEKNLPDKMYDLVVEGIACKVRECCDVYGIYGSFVAIWFSRFFAFTLFPIGRFEFAPFSCPLDLPQLGIKKGEPLIDVHIPSRGKLDPADAEESYREALSFFDSYFGKSHKGFFCESWLIYPDNRKIIPKCSNIIAFMDDFYIYHSEEDMGDLWRIFGSSSLDYPEKPLSASTYMQKQFKEHFENGGKMGLGFGVKLIP